MVLVPRGEEDMIDVQGKIALISLRLPHERAIRNMQSRGAIAVVMGGFTGRKPVHKIKAGLTNTFAGVPGFVMFTGDNGDTSDIMIPVAELADENWQLLEPNLNSSVELFVVLSSEGRNVCYNHCKLNHFQLILTA